MCGIFGIISKEEDAPSKVFKGLQDIEYRGYDSWGIAAFSNNAFKVSKKTGFLPPKINFPKSNIALGHTRWATHGGVTQKNAHPHLDCTGKIVLVHNGIVENFQELKNTLSGHTFKSETDSEIIVHLIEDKVSLGFTFKDAVSAAFSELKGLNAIVVSNGIEIIACKVGSPLVVGKLEEGFAVASDPNALLPFTHELLFMEDKQMVSLNGKLELFSTENKAKIEPQISEVHWDYASTSLGSYQHFTLKEIEEQPKVLQNLVNNEESIKSAADLIKSSSNVWLLGCGSAAFACLAGVYFFSEYTKKNVQSVVGSEFDLIKESIGKNSLIIAVSQSGETMDVIEPVGIAKSQGAKIVALTNTLGSSLYRVSDKQVLLNAGVEKAVCSTKALTAMIADLLLLSLAFSGNLDQGAEIILKSSKEIERVISQKKSIERLADKILGAEHIYILGRGLSYPVALESALKIKEISYIHAEGFASGELKHGVIALIEKGTPVIVFVPEDQTKEAILANAMEVKSRGAFVIGVGEKNNKVFDYFFEVNDTGASSILPHIVFSQTLAYFLSVKKGFNPDKPRNLAKSVVVK